jgi:hypothetical protein
MTDVPSGPWALVLDLQRAASCPAVGPRTVGCDEALEVMLDDIGHGIVLDARAVRNLCANRAGKDRHRRRLARREGVPSIGTPAIDELDLKRAVLFVAEALGPDDFALLVAVTETSYVEVASRIAMPVGTLKARLSRAKARARAAWLKRFGLESVLEAA